MNQAEEKNKIRKEIKVLKDKLSIDEKRKRSSWLFEKIERLEIFKNAKVILLYWSMKDEVYTHEFIIKWAKEKKLLLPSVTGDVLVIREFKGINQMKLGDFWGIPEPDGEIFNDYSKIDLTIIPGIAFDKINNRLGRGKAFYDKLLKNIFVFKIGVCFNFQLLEIIPANADDMKMDMVITD